MNNLNPQNLDDKQIFTLQLLLDTGHIMEYDFLEGSHPGFYVENRKVKREN